MRCKGALDCELVINGIKSLLTVRSLSILLLIALATLILAACGEDATPTPTQTPTVAPSPTPTFVTNASGQRIAGQGNTISVHYRGTLNNGEEFDTSRDKEPISFVLGSGQLLQGFEDAVRGMAVGETKTFSIPPAEAYGEEGSTAPETVPLSALPEGLEVGEEFSPVEGVTGKVVAIQGEYAWVQVPHPLEGETLNFEIEVVDVQ